MGLWKSLAGEISVEITSASPAEAIHAINEIGITASEVVQTGDLKIVMTIYRRDYRKLLRLLIHRGENIKLLERNGVFWTIISLRKRPVLIATMLIYLFLIAYLPTRVLFFKVEGNETVSTQEILEEAEACGICFGASRRNVRSEQMKNSLLEAMPQLQWAGINTFGCVAVISVQEKSLPKEELKPTGISSVIAKSDGVIRQVTVLRGNPLCTVGQAVKAGQMLVSGYTDCGIVIKAEAADAEIYAETRHQMETISPVLFVERTDLTNKQTRYSMLFGKKIINLFKDSGISDVSCVRMYKKYYLTLPGGFQLPFALIEEQLLYYNQHDISISDETASELVQRQTEEYLLEQMIAGKVLESALVTDFQSGVCRQYAQYACLEMIGQVRSEEIIKGNE